MWSYEDEDFRKSVIKRGVVSRKVKISEKVILKEGWSHECEGFRKKSGLYRGVVPRK